MFTGIIEGTGKIVGVKETADFRRMTVKFPRNITGIRTGDSIAVDGVCLTAVEIKGENADFEIVRNTLEKTTLGGLKNGSIVNLERAMRLGDRLSGHFVTGHIDGVGRIVRRMDGKDVCSLNVEVPEELADYIVPRGSVALDGISLTVAGVEGTVFILHIIPETLKVTTLKYKKENNRVNIETDLLGKYARKFTQTGEKRKDKSNISAGFLAEHGFI